MSEPISTRGLTWQGGFTQGERSSELPPPPSRAGLDLISQNEGDLPRRREARDAGAEVVAALFRLVKLSTMHAVDNLAVVQRVEEMVEAVRTYAQRTGRNVSILFLDDAVLVGGQLLQANRSSYEAAREVGALLAKLGVTEVGIARDARAADFFALATALGEALRAARGTRAPERPSPRVRLRAASPLALRRDGPTDRLDPLANAANAYASACVVMRRLYEQLGKGQLTLPHRVKRIAQRLVDLSAGEMPAFLGVTDAKRGGHDDAQRAVNASILTLAMARQITTDPVLLSRIAMAALLFDVGRFHAAGAFPGSGRIVPNLSSSMEQEVPAATAMLLTALGRVNEPSVMRTVMAYEACSVGRRDPVGLLYEGAHPPTLQAFLIAVARAYVEAVSSTLGSPARTADEAIARLQERWPDGLGRTSVRLLVGALGLFPSGTLVELSTGEVAAVIATPADPSQYSMPRVRIVLDMAGHPIDAPFEVDLANPPPGTPARRIRKVVPGTIDVAPTSIRTPVPPSSSPRSAVTPTLLTGPVPRPAASRPGAALPPAPAVPRGARPDGLVARPAAISTPPTKPDRLSQARSSTPTAWDLIEEDDAGPLFSPMPPEETLDSPSGLDFAPDRDALVPEPAGRADSEPPASIEPPPPSADSLARMAAIAIPIAIGPDPFDELIEDGPVEPGDAPARVLEGSPIPEGSADLLLAYDDDDDRAHDDDRDGADHPDAAEAPGASPHAPAASPRDDDHPHAPPGAPDVTAEASPDGDVNGDRDSDDDGRTRAYTSEQEGLVARTMPPPPELLAAIVEPVRPAPTAEGSFTKTPLVHLLVYVLDQRLTGTVTFFPPDGLSHDVYIEQGVPSKIRTGAMIWPLDRVLQNLRLVDEARLNEALVEISRTRMLLGRHLVMRGLCSRDDVLHALRVQLVQKLVSLCDLPVETKYAFYRDVNLIKTYGGPEMLGGSPLATIMAAVRASPGSPASEATLTRIAHVQLGFVPYADVTPFDLSREEIAVCDLLRARRMRVRELIQAGVAPEHVVKRVIYALVITRYLDLGGQQKPPVAFVQPEPAGERTSDAGTASIPGIVNPAAKAQARQAQTQSPSPPQTAAHSPAQTATHSPPQTATQTPHPPAAAPRAHAPQAPPQTPLPPPATKPLQVSMPPGGNRPVQISMPPAASAPVPLSLPPLTTKAAATSTSSTTSIRSPADLAARKHEIQTRAASIESDSYFEVLGIARGASTDEARNAYFGLAKRWHPDRTPPELAEMKPLVATVFAKIGEAYATLGDSERRSAYLSQLESAGPSRGQEDEIVERAVNAALEFQKAEVLLKKNDIAGAERHVRRAADADPGQPEYTTLLAWVSALRRGEPGELLPGQISTHYDDLIHILDEVLRGDPRYERALFYRGILNKRSGKLDKAIRDFRVAADLNPRNLDAAREVRLYEMRKRETKSEADAAQGLFGKWFKR